MKHLQNIVMFMATLGLFSVSVMAQDQKPSPSPEDRVYTAKEVDRKAVIKNRKELDPERWGTALDCRSGATVIVKAVLHKSGGVKGVEVIKRASCSLDEKAKKIITYAKFEPAMKDGVAVSQFIEVTYTFRKY